MDQADFKAFARIMALMQEVFVPDKEISKLKMELYFEHLSDLTIEQIASATESMIRSRKYASFPLPAEIREAAGANDQETLELEAQKAWSELCTLCDRMGFSEPEVRDPILKRAIQVAFGSIKHFGELDPAMEAADRKHFISCYIKVAKQEFKVNQQLGSSLIKQLVENRKKLEAHQNAHTQIQSDPIAQNQHIFDENKKRSIKCITEDLQESKGL